MVSVVVEAQGGEELRTVRHARARESPAEPPKPPMDKRRRPDHGGPKRQWTFWPAESAFWGVLRNPSGHFGSRVWTSLGAASDVFQERYSIIM